MTAYRDRLHAGHYEDKPKDDEGLKPIKTAPLMQRTPRAKRTPKAKPSK